MLQKKKIWFTLIELIVSISIFFLLSMMAFAPYSFYLNKSKVKHTSKEISQVIYAAKNKSINGSATSTWNLSTWIYFDSMWDNKHSYKLLSFPHAITTSNILLENAVWVIESKLQPWIQFEKIWWKSKWIIFFRSITGSGVVLTWGSLLIDSDNEIDVEYSYKWASYWLLHWKLQYFQDTQIVDY